MKKISLAACALTVVGAAHGATVVHDAGRDLVLNSTSANVYTNAYGGVWSFMRSTSPTGARTLMPGVRTRTVTGEIDAQGRLLVYGRGPAKGDASPCFSVNPRAVPDDKTFMRGDGWPKIPAGQMSCHPGSPTDAGNQCCVLRFATPRAGTYAVTAKAWNQNKGWTAVSLLVNGEVRSARKAWTSTATAVVTNDFSIAAAPYEAGDTIELTVDGNNTFDSNATGFRFEVAETVETVVDAGAAIEAHLAANGTSAAFSDASGSWRAESASDTTVLSHQGRTLLNTSSVRTAQGSGARGWNTGGSTPWFHVNATDGYVTETNATGAATIDRGVALVPHELYAHPHPDQPVLLGWSPAASGVYDVGVTMRDVSYTFNTEGVRIRLLQGGRELASQRISVEGAAGVKQNATFFLRNVAVAAGVPIELVVDPYDGHNGDGTALTWTMIKVGEGTVYSANGALIANLNSASPSSTYEGDGATWKVGTLANGTLTPFTTLQTTRTTAPDKALGNTANTSPYVGANLKGRALTKAETSGNQLIAGGRDMVIGHPGSYGVVSALRFVAPEDGVYSAQTFFMDLDGGLNDTGRGNGILARVFANDRLAKVDGVMSSAGTVDCKTIDAPDLHLRAGDVVDFAIHPNGTDAYDHSCDQTGLYAWLVRDPAASALVRVNIDFDAAGGTTYAGTGAGRYGYRGEAWDSFRVPSAATAKFSRTHLAGSGERTGMTLTLAHGDAPIVANAGNTNTTDVSDAAALFVDGIVSATTNDVYTFTIAGLQPGGEYMLGFYSRTRTSSKAQASAETTRNGVFTAGGASDKSTHPWFSEAFGDFANLKVKADAEGVVTGTFNSAVDAPAYWNGLQVEGPGFAAPQPGMSIIVR